MVKTIAVEDEVYDLLVRLKLRGESFSDTIRRIVKKGSRISDIEGSKTVVKGDWLEVVEAFEGQG